MFENNKKWETMFVNKRKKNKDKREFDLADFIYVKNLGIGGYGSVN